MSFSILNFNFATLFQNFIVKPKKIKISCIRNRIVLTILELL